jgi:hypothetical protein
VEVLLRADNLSDVHTFLSFYIPDRPLQLELRQNGSGLLIFPPVRNSRNHLVNAEIDVDHVFRPGKPTLLTITSGARGTTVYLDGQFAQAAPGYHLSESNFSGQLMLGSAPLVYDAWSGDLSGLAFYGSELTAQRVRQNYAAWSQSGKVAPDASDNPLALYLFAEHSGSAVRNEVAAGPALNIPAHFQVPYKPILLPPWREITPPWIYTADIIRNILGFVPLGMVFYLYFLRVRERKSAALVSVVLGALTSLTIEVLQAFIPQRVSGMTDIITNTLGTALGVLLLQPKAIRVILATWGVTGESQEVSQARK